MINLHLIVLYIYFLCINLYLFKHLILHIHDIYTYIGWSFFLYNKFCWRIDGTNALHDFTHSLLKLVLSSSKSVGELLAYLLLALELYVHNSELVDLLLDLVDVVADFYCTNK